MNSTDPADPREPVEADGRAPRRLGRWSIPAAVSAALIAWLVGETSLVRVAPKGVPQVVMGQPITATTAQTEQAAVVATAVRLYGVFGAALGLALGAAGGLARRSPRGALTSALVGAALGAVAGVVTSFVGVPLFHRFRDLFANDLVTSLLLHGAVWAAVGASAALALGRGAGAGRRHLARLLTGGALGALLGTAVFEVLGALFFANEETGEPVSTTARTRLLALLIVGAFTAVGASAACGERRRRARTPAPPDLSREGS